MPPGTNSANRARCSPTRRLRASLSSTHGPAMRKSASRWKCWPTSVGGFDKRSRALLGRVASLPLHGRRDESGEQRMRARRSRLQLGVELTTDEPRVIRQLDDLDQLSVGREATQLHAVLYEHVAVRIRNLISMPVTLADFGLPVNLRGA